METSANDLRRLYEINVIGPAMLTRECLPLLRKASTQHSPFNNTEMSISRAGVLNISSMLGSITNSQGCHYSYGMSKAALNMLTRNLSVELKSDHVLVMSIGCTDDDFTTDEFVSGILHEASNCTEEHTGGFYAWNGGKIPW